MNDCALLTTGADVTCANLNSKGVDGCFTVSFYIFENSKLAGDQDCKSFDFTYSVHQNETVKTYFST